MKMSEMINGDFVIVHLLRGESGRYHEELVKTVGPKFNENYLIENPRPSHFTLKAPFWADDIAIIEDLLEAFVKTQKSQSISVGGFSNFREKVIFLNSEFSEEAIKIQKDLVEELRKIRGFPLDRHDLAFTPHLTIGYGNTLESFKGMVEYLNSLPDKKFETNFDNVALLKKNKNVWEVYKIYEIK